MNSLFDSGQDYICDYAATQVKSAVLFLLGLEKLKLQAKKAFFRLFIRVDINVRFSL